MHAYARSAATVFAGWQCADLREERVRGDTVSERGVHGCAEAWFGALVQAYRVHRREKGRSLMPAHHQRPTTRYENVRVFYDASNHDICVAQTATVVF